MLCPDQGGFLTMIGGERKGGALAPPKSRLEFFILSRARRSPEASGLRRARDKEMISKASQRRG